VRPYQVRLSDRQIMRVLTSQPPDRRLVLCLQLMASAVADHDVVVWLMFRHLFDLTVIEARS
jgi:hypothetical protein